MKDMREIKVGLKRLADEELIRANAVHEPRFVDTEHRFGVLYGERKELNDEVEHLNDLFEIYETYELVHRSTESVIDLVEEMRKTSLAAAAELVQYIAMCEKALASLMHEKDRDEMTAWDKLMQK